MYKTFSEVLPQKKAFVEKNLNCLRCLYLTVFPLLSEFVIPSWSDQQKISIKNDAS